MIITEIKKIGSGKRYRLFVDYEEVGIFQDEILAKYQLKTGQEIEEDLFQKIKKQNFKTSAFDMAITYLEKYVKSEKGIREYLKQKGYDNDTIDSTCEKLNEYGFINDRAFAESYVKTYIHKKGRKALEFDLKLKGVSEEIIQEILEEIDEDEEKEVAIQIAKKYLKNKPFDEKNKQKCKNYLFSKGFSSSICNFAVDSLGEENEDWI